MKIYANMILEDPEPPTNMLRGSSLCDQVTHGSDSDSRSGGRSDSSSGSSSYGALG